MTTVPVGLHRQMKTAEPLPLWRRCEDVRPPKAATTAKEIKRLLKSAETRQNAAKCRRPRRTLGSGRSGGGHPTNFLHNFLTGQGLRDEALYNFVDSSDNHLDMLRDKRHVSSVYRPRFPGDRRLQVSFMGDLVSPLNHQ